MREAIFTGVCTAIVTPFDPSGEIDLETFGALIDRQIEAGVDAICVCGTTGEGATLSLQEHEALVSYCVKRADRRVKIIAGAGSNNTATSLTLALQAQAAGADALLCVTPYYNKTTQAGLIRHFTYLADRVEIPIILYNVPSRTGLSCRAETYYELSQHPNIAGVKEASGDFSLITHTRALCGDDLPIWSGNDDQIVPMMALGAKGVISVLSSLLPEETVRLTWLCLEGDYTAAAALQFKYAPLIDALFSQVNPIPIKEAMALAGYPAGGLRLPLCKMDPAQREHLKTEMAQLGILA